MQTIIRRLIVAAGVLIAAAYCWRSLLHSADIDRLPAAQAQINALQTALGAYELDVGGYPNDGEGLAALTSNVGGHPGWDGPYLPRDAAAQSVGSNYIYRCCDANGEPEIEASKK
jgi:general secretion pathway protein G